MIYRVSCTIDSKAQAHAEAPESIIFAGLGKRLAHVDEETGGTVEAVINAAADVKKPLGSVMKLAAASAIGVRSEAPFFDGVPGEQVGADLIGPVKFLDASLESRSPP